MVAPITGFRLDAVHTFQVRTLQSLGYRTRVALSNNSDTNPDFTTAYRIDVSVYGPSRARERFFGDVARLEPRKKLLIDCEHFVAGFDVDVEIILHLIPLRLEPKAKDGLVTTSREELFFLFGAQDHYVEYYREDGFSSGVLYQSGAFNYDKFSRDATTLIQAPKGYIAAKIDTIVSVLNSSLAPDYNKTASLKCSLQDGTGHRVAWVEEVPPFQPVSISMKSRAADLGMKLGDEPQFLCFMGICETTTLVPLTISRDLETGCIGIEHSLPPLYYAASLMGKMRARTIASFARANIFQVRG
jgi:hypothetical protein